jgi:uncharacterized protein with von Willebrand factor type A (vWA) domain
MRERILAFVERLRAGGLELAVAETLDAVAAAAAVGMERPTLREALAACLVKDEATRGAFDAVFDESFPLGASEGDGTGRGRRRAGGGAASAGRGRGGSGGAERERAEVSHEAVGHGETGAGGAAPRAHAVGRGEANSPQASEAPRNGRAARRRALMALPFHAFTTREVEEARALVRELGTRLAGRLRRRSRAARRGRLDFRRTIRAALSTGGVPARPRWRARRPGPPDLVALCDLSGSVAAASELLLGLLAPAAEHFRRVHLFAYVDRLCPVSIEAGHVAPGAPLDLHARSDFGRVLQDLLTHEASRLTRSTLLLVLGDARNNRRGPRLDLLRRVHERVSRIVWLVPEPEARWNAGDSVLGLYAPLCDLVSECLDLGTLVRAVRHAL